MKSLFFISLIFSTTVFAHNTIVCKHTGFSDLEIELKSAGPKSFVLKVLKSGLPGPYTPTAGEKSVLEVDNDLSGLGTTVLSTQNVLANSRYFEISLFDNNKRASLRSGKMGSDLVLANYDLTCK